MKKTRLIQRMWAKVLAFIMFIVFLAVAVGSAVGIGLMIECGIYTTEKSKLENELIFERYGIISSHLVEIYVNGTDDEFESYCRRHLISYVSIKRIETDGVVREYGTAREDEFDTEYLSYDLDGDAYHSIYERLEIRAQYDFSPEALSEDNYLSTVLGVIDMAYALRYWIFLIFVAGLSLAVAHFVFLMCSSGRRVGSDGVSAGWGTGVPFDILIAVYVLCLDVLLGLCFDYLSLGEIWQVILTALAVLALVCFFVGICMSFAVRLKLGRWWKNTLIYYILRTVYRLCRFVFKLASRLPLIWKSALVIVAVTFVEFIFIAANMYEGDNILVLFVLEKMLLIPAAVYVLLCLKKLHMGAQDMAAGKSEYHIDTCHMIGDMKAHGECLNRMGEGINIAVEQRMKSERMKTELITNVSHDIKTPLTSIINYSDLIAKEKTENEKITEYSVVLLRQSERLKRLIDDLVEASKAQTGNLEVVSAPFDLGVFFGQSAGEYEQRFAEKELIPVIVTPDEPVVIMADGRRMWRIFDNLMNNICKYAQPLTRVYMTLEKKGDKASVTFRNTSRDQLNVSAEELMERFTRGDSSRNTEGNGLGLAIARSLVQLQNGEMDITVDGDLFKVTLVFPVIESSRKLTIS